MPHTNNDELIKKLDKAYNQQFAKTKAHQAKINNYDSIMLKWKRFNSFLHAGTVMSILFIIITSFSEYSAYQATATAITLICIVAGIIQMSILSYYQIRISMIFKKMSRIIDKSMKEIIEEIEGSDNG